MANTKAISRRYRITTGDNGNTLEIGQPAAGVVGGFMIQLVPSTFTGSVTVQARVAGPDIDALATPQPIPYRKLSLGGVAGDLTAVSAALTGAAIIIVPAGGLSVSLLVACTVGFCDVLIADLDGCPAV